MTVGSLFSGIGGFDLGLERADMTVKWQVENEPYCIKVLEKHWPHVTRYTDITTVDWSGVEPVDLVCGGFPCQPVSVACKRKGTADERWLWPEFVRCFSVLRPRYIIVENVPGLLTANNGRAFTELLRDLAACGYNAEWDCLPASAFGGPHLRDRLYFVAYPGSQSEYRSIFTKDGSKLGRGEEVRCQDWKFFTLVAGVPTGFGQWREMGQPGLVRIDDGIPDVLDRLHATGNAVVPQIVEWIGRRVLAHSEGD